MRWLLNIAWRLVLHPVIAPTNRHDDCERVEKLFYAIQGCTIAIKLDPKGSTAYYYRGIAYAKLGNFDRAIADFDRFIEFNPRAARGYLNRGITHSLKGEPDCAITDYDDAIKLEPNDPEAYARRWIEYLEKGDEERAKADYDRCEQLSVGSRLSFLF